MIVAFFFLLTILRLTILSMENQCLGQTCAELLSMQRADALDRVNEVFI